MTRFIFHIGWPKTGTSTIQSFFNRRQELRDVGVLYPRFALARGGHHSLGPPLFNLHRSKLATLQVSPESIYPALMREAEAAQCSTVMVSSEAFSHARSFNAEVLRSFRDHDVVIAAFLRRQDYWINSAVNQLTKNPNPRKTIDGLFTHVMRRAEYLRLLQPWADYFGRDSIRVFPLRKADNSLARMLRFLDLSGQVDPAAAASRNVSISFESAMFMWTAGHVLRLSRKQRMRMRRVLIEMDEAHPAKRFFFFSKDVRRAQVERYAEMNRSLFETFRADVAGAGFEEDLDDIDDYQYREPAEYTTAEFRAKLAAVAERLPDIRMAAKAL